MNGRAFLNTGHRLLNLPVAAEEDWRTAAGRAYYALLVETRDILQRWGFTPPAKDSLHAYVRLRFSYAAVADLKQIGYMLDQLNRLRNLADYEMGTIPSFASAAKAQRALMDAGKALVLLDQIAQDPARRAAAVAALQAAGP
jgi:hypothetical protein